MANGLMENIYNPDVLSCIANLSNDEVFTPPEVANAMLDMLPKEVFESKETKFLDPACKSGVFLREIAKRLIKAQFPDYETKTAEINEKKNNGQKLTDEEKKYLNELQEEIDHVFKNQLYGIAITELTSMLSRRSVYCSKYPNGDYSVTKFDNAEGNIYFGESKHLFINKKCIDCGATEAEYGEDKRQGLESHAYQFIHKRFMPGVFENMQFDVIIGNPPYQLSDGGASASATPIYHEFIEQAKKLNPRYMSFIVPARWYAGGKGLDKFRDDMLHDERIRIIHDFMNSSECFSGVEIKGGICYFLWERDNKGLCEVYNHSNNKPITKTTRSLLENGCTTFIRFNEAIPILNKVLAKSESKFADLVSSRKPFGLPTNFKGTEKSNKNDIVLYENGGTSYVSLDKLEKGKELVDKYKVYITNAYGAGEDFPHQILNIPFVGNKHTACTETYLLIGPFNSEDEAKNVCSYIKTRFFRFLVLLLKNTQHATQKVYDFVPMQDFKKSWSDKDLYEKYNINETEQAFITSMIRPME